MKYLNTFFKRLIFFVKMRNIYMRLQLHWLISCWRCCCCSYYMSWISFVLVFTSVSDQIISLWTTGQMCCVYQLSCIIAWTIWWSRWYQRFLRHQFDLVDFGKMNSFSWTRKKNSWNQNIEKKLAKANKIAFLKSSNSKSLK